MGSQLNHTWEQFHIIAEATGWMHLLGTFRIGSVPFRLSAA